MFTTVQMEQTECLEQKRTDISDEYTIGFWLHDVLYFAKLIKPFDDNESISFSFSTLDEEDGYVDIKFSQEESQLILESLHAFLHSLEPLLI